MVTLIWGGGGLLLRRLLAVLMLASWDAPPPVGSGPGPRDASEGGGRYPPPPPGRPAYAQPLSPCRENFFTPVVYVQNDQRVMGTLLRYLCRDTHGPPLGSPAADRPTPLPPPPPPLQTPKSFRTRLGSRIRTGRPCRVYQQVPLSMALVTDSDRPQPLRQPPPTARLTASGASSAVPSLLMHPGLSPSCPDTHSQRRCHTPRGRGDEGRGGCWSDAAHDGAQEGGGGGGGLLGAGLSQDLRDPLF